MVQTHAILGNKSAETAQRTHWGRFKDRLSGYMEKNREKRLVAAMEKGNAARVLKLFEKISGENKGKAASWLVGEARFDFETTERIYGKAKEKDEFYTGLFVKAYTELDEKEKGWMWHEMSLELESMLGLARRCDVIDSALKNTARIYAAIGKVDMEVNHTKCWDAFVDIAYGKNGNSLATRMFALDALQASDYGYDKFWESIIACNGNGENHELARHGIKLLLKPDTKGSEELLLKKIDKVAERLVELSYSKDGDLNKKRMMEFIAGTLADGSEEQRLALLDALNESKKLGKGLMNPGMEAAVAKLLRSGDDAFVGGAVHFLHRMQWCPESVKKDLISLIGKRMETERIVKLLMHGRIHADEAEMIISAIFQKMKERKDVSAYARLYIFVQSLLTGENKKAGELTKIGMKRLVEKNDEFAKQMAKNMLLNAEQMLNVDEPGACSEGVKLLNVLEFTGKTEGIKKVVEKRLKERIEAMFESPEIEENVNAADILIVLSPVVDAKMIIAKIAIPELRDMAEDEGMSKENLMSIEGALHRLEKVMCDG
ncbi:hypothetical protein H0O02_02480 [Candidatus Micrarchaeota archaeon]|nr:hypothetical protein [Candidatus Micrarchaeota archaeon]